MKIIALHNVEVAGYGIVKRGTIIDYGKGRIDERIAANFLNAADDSRLKVSKKASDAQPGLLKKTKEEMLAEQEAERTEARKHLLEKLGIDGIKEQLAEVGVNFTTETTENELCDLYLHHIGG